MKINVLVWMNLIVLFFTPLHAMEEQTSPPISSLPHEVIMHVMDFLPSKEIVKTFSGVSKEWHELSQDQPFWQYQVKQSIGKIPILKEACKVRIAFESLTSDAQDIVRQLILQEPYYKTPGASEQNTIWDILFQHPSLGIVNPPSRFLSRNTYTDFLPFFLYHLLWEKFQIPYKKCIDELTNPRDWWEGMLFYRQHINQTFFPALFDIKQINCCDCNLMTVDIRGLHNLNTFICNHNKLTQLTIEGLKKLDYLSCTYNQLTHLKIKGTPNLRTIRLTGNPLPSEKIAKLERRIPCVWF